MPLDITFGDEMLDAGTNVDAFFDTWFIGASYRFAAVVTPVVEIGPLLGLVLLHLSGIGVSDSAAGRAVTATQGASFSCPQASAVLGF